MSYEDEEEFRISRGGGGRGGRGGRRGPGGWGRRRPYYGYGLGYGLGYGGYPSTYYVEGDPSQEQIDCIYAAGACKDQMKEKVGDHGLKNPEDVCKQGDVQQYVQGLPVHCRPESYNYKVDYSGAAMGVL